MKFIFLVFVEPIMFLVASVFFSFVFYESWLIYSTFTENYVNTTSFFESEIVGLSDYNIGMIGEFVKSTCLPVIEYLSNGCLFMVNVFSKGTSASMQNNISLINEIVLMKLTILIKFSYLIFTGILAGMLLGNVRRIHRRVIFDRESSSKKYFGFLISGFCFIIRAVIPLPLGRGYKAP